MALTHTHRVVLQDYAGEDARQDHSDSRGNAFGHDEHVAFMKKRGDNARAGWEHTHEDVEERYDVLSDTISLHPVKTKEELAAEKKVEEAQANLDKVQADAAGHKGEIFNPSPDVPVLDPHPAGDVPAASTIEDEEVAQNEEKKEKPVAVTSSSGGSSSGTGTA